jgi:hypothetical protein
MRKVVSCLLVAYVCFGFLCLGLTFHSILRDLAPNAARNAPSEQSERCAQPAVIMCVLDESLEQFAPAWQTEIARRFPNAVGILCHGGQYELGRWIVKTDSSHLMTARDLALVYQHLYPGRTIVLLACNPGHLALGIPGVYHFHSSVWCVPDRATGRDDEADRITLDAPATRPMTPTLTRWQRDPDVEGNIFEADER